MRRAFCVYVYYCSEIKLTCLSEYQHSLPTTGEGGRAVAMGRLVVMHTNYWLSIGRSKVTIVYSYKLFVS